MTLDQYIEALEAIRAEHGGGMQVNTLGFNGNRQKAMPPRISNTLILEGRERAEKFWHPNYPEHLRGEKVVRV